jgi:uncharacterized protein (TIGR02246 family)
MWSGTPRQKLILPAFLLVVGAIAGLELCTAFGRVYAQADPAPKTQTEPAAQNEDGAAVRAALDSFAKAFESRDAKALAAHWTTGGEYHPLDGATVRGREALEKGFTAFFAKTPEVKAQIQHGALRFLASDAAIEEGTASIRRGPLEPTLNSRYSAMVVRENGQWRLAQLSESPGDKESIEDLGWLVGEWHSKGKQGAEIQTTYSWHANKKFIQAQFTIKEKQRTFSGNQIIGVDPATGALHSWTFEADGGIGEADWHRDGDHWVLDAAGTLSDGRELTETNILRRVNQDTITWQSVDRYLEDGDLADLPPVKMTRVKPGQ